MTRARGHAETSGGALLTTDTYWLDSVAQAAAAETSVPAELLGGYLTLVANAALTGRRPPRGELGDVRVLGRQAAKQGVGAGEVVDLFLSATWRLWSQLPAQIRTGSRVSVSAAAEIVLQVVGDAVAVLVEGHQAERRHMVRREEATRREVIDDLLRGDSDVARMIERAEPFGLDLGRPHLLVLAVPATHLADYGPATALLERSVVDKYGDRDVLVATKDDQIVVLLPEHKPVRSAGTGGDNAGTFVHTMLSRVPKGDPWRVASGRPYAGAYGIARSYEEAREALELAGRLHLDTEVVNARDLLVYRVLVRDQAAIIELVDAVLGPLSQARGGPEPLLTTLEAYFESGGVATATARRLHMSVRTVTYRLAKIATLTQHDPAEPAQRFALQIAVVGARLLQWPERDLSITG
jgi:sugar diacid utilization regulator